MASSSPTYEPLEVEIEAVMHQLITDAEHCYEQVFQQTVDWSALQWSHYGPGTLFEQFRLAGSWADFITSQVIDIEFRRNKVLAMVNKYRAQVERVVEENAAKAARDLVVKGLAYQERSLMARIQTGAPVFELTLFDRKLAQLDGCLSVLRTKAKTFTDFKADAKTATSLMNFGNQLGELR